jgi:hypothetical protein
LGGQDDLALEVAVKLAFAAFALIGLPAVAADLQIFGQQISLDPGCRLEVRLAGGLPETLPLPLGLSGNCRIIEFGGTNVPHLENVQGSYVFLVESRKEMGGACVSTYAAVVVSQVGRVKVVPKARDSATCGADRDRFEFEYLFKQRQ